MTNSSDDRILERMQAEYVEMPEMSRRLDQLARLCGVETSMCKRVLDILIETKFLHLKEDGAYARRTPEADHLRLAKVH